MVPRLFVYGTLQSPAIWQRVTGLRGMGEPTILDDYRRFGFTGEAFPGMVPSEGGQVCGQLYRRIPARVWRLLDRYEGDWYRRHTVTVTTPTGETVRAQTYVVRPAWRFRLSQKPWSYAHFLRRYQQQYLSWKP